MMCLLWGQTEFARGTVKVRNGTLPRDIVDHLWSRFSVSAFGPGLCG
jgi:hypothetical protein